MSDIGHIIVGDCCEVLRTLPKASIDAVVTNPLHAISIDPSKRHLVDDGAAFESWAKEWTTECLRVLRPRGCLLAFGDTRMWHRLAAGAEGAGFRVVYSVRRLKPVRQPTCLLQRGQTARLSCRLVSPPGSLVLDPFLGAGATAVAAIKQGLSFIGIEKDATYAKTARRQIAVATEQVKQGGNGEQPSSIQQCRQCDSWVFGHDRPGNLCWECEREDVGRIPPGVDVSGALPRAREA